MIKNITVYLDNSQSDFMETLRCGFIVAENENGDETFHTDVIDSSDYYSIKELVDDIVGIFRIERNAVLVAS